MCLRVQVNQLGANPVSIPAFAPITESWLYSELHCVQPKVVNHDWVQQIIINLLCFPSLPSYSGGMVDITHDLPFLDTTSLNLGMTV